MATNYCDCNLCRYCFGAPYVCDQLADGGVCTAGAFAHPAFLKETHFRNLKRKSDAAFPPRDLTDTIEKSLYSSHVRRLTIPLTPTLGDEPSTCSLKTTRSIMCSSSQGLSTASPCAATRMIHMSVSQGGLRPLAKQRRHEP